MKRLIVGSFLFLATALFLQACAKTPIRVLLVTGQNNHHWEISHISIKQLLENSGLFTVDLAVSPGKGKDLSGFVPNFTPFQLVVVDYNGDSWPEEAKKRFEAYVENGGGVIIYHAADNSFPSWKAYNEMCALGGWEGRNEQSGPYVYWQDGKLIKDNTPGNGGSHGRQHQYILNKRDMNHPITQGLPTRWLHAKDELYDHMRGPGKIEALLYTAYSDPATGGSGREEPLIFTVKYGRGRIFHTMLGHAGQSLEENTAMQCAGFQILFLRGAEWASTGKVEQKVPADFPTETHLSLRKNYR